MQHCWGGSGRAAVAVAVTGSVAVAGGGSGEGEWLRQWWGCHGIVGVAGAQCLHGGIVGVGGGRWMCCGVGEAAVGLQWWGGMMEEADLTLRCWCVGGIVIKIVFSCTMSYS